MPVFACRWPNGDVSFIMAPNKDTAIERLDEVGNAERAEVLRVARFQIHLTLTDDGHFQFEEFGEDTEHFVWKTLYPQLDHARETVFGEQPETNPPSITPAQEALIRGAVKREREEGIANDGSEPRTELGKDIKLLTDMPSTGVNKLVEESAIRVLKKVRPKGKRH